MNKIDLKILVFLVILSAISVLNFKVYGQDFDLPIAAALTLSPTYVDFSSAGVVVTLSVRVSDISGVQLEQVPKGVYMVQLNGKTVQKTVKIIRE